MAGISMAGMGSGLPPNIVDQLMEAEKMPIKSIEKTKSKQENRLKLVTDLESKLNGVTGGLVSLANARGFTDMKLSTGDQNVVTGTVDPNTAKPGTWNVEVLGLARKSAALSNGFPDKDKTRVGVGYFKFDTPDGEKDVYLKSDHNTLADAATAINRAGVGVRASVIDDRATPDAPFKLMVTSDKMGGDNKMKFPTLYFLDGDQDINFEIEKPARNGKVRIDGFDFEVGENVVKDVIPGVTLDLKQAAPGRGVNIDVKEDREVVAGKVKGFVDGVNSVLKFIQEQNQLTEKSDTSSSLGGDSLLRSVEQKLRGLLQNSQVGAGGNITRLSQVGIAFNRQGVLEYDEKKFNDTLAKTPNDVQKFLAGDGFQTGFVPSLRREIGGLLNAAFGPVAVRKKSLQDRIGQMNDQIANKERQLAKKEEMLRNKFARLDETMGKMKSQMGQVSAMGQG